MIDLISCEDKKEFLSLSLREIESAARERDREIKKAGLMAPFLMISSLCFSAYETVRAEMIFRDADV